MLKLPTRTAVQRLLEKKILCYNLVPFILLSTIALHVTLFVDLLVTLSRNTNGPMMAASLNSRQMT